jgi:hypothetical protein
VVTEWEVNKSTGTMAWQVLDVNRLGGVTWVSPRWAPESQMTAPRIVAPMRTTTASVSIFEIGWSVLPFDRL